MIPRYHLNNFDGNLTVLIIFLYLCFTNNLNFELWLELNSV